MRRKSNSSAPVQKPPSFYTAVYAVVAKIPRGRVTTYGHIATWLGSPRAARAVGYALAALPEGGTAPWHRVVNRLGGISVGGALWRPDEQRRRLRAEKIRLDSEGCLSLEKYAWVPTAAQQRAWHRRATQLKAERLV